MKEVVDTKQYKKINPYIIAFTVLLPAFLALAASSATNVCQPNIAGYFGATPYEANTVVTSYIISGGLMLPITVYCTVLYWSHFLPFSREPSNANFSKNCTRNRQWLHTAGMSGSSVRKFSH